MDNKINSGMSRATMWVIGLLATLFLTGLGGSYALTSAVNTKFNSVVSHREMDSKYGLLLDEIKYLRQEVKELRDEVMSMKPYLVGSVK